MIWVILCWSPALLRVKELHSPSHKCQESFCSLAQNPLIANEKLAWYTVLEFLTFLGGKRGTCNDSKQQQPCGDTRDSGYHPSSTAWFGEFLHLILCKIAGIQKAAITGDEEKCMLWKTVIFHHLKGKLALKRCSAYCPACLQVYEYSLVKASTFWEGGGKKDCSAKQGWKSLFVNYYFSHTYVPL